MPGSDEFAHLGEPVLVSHLFAEEREALLDLLTGLDREAWERSTVCPGWTVKDVALHLLGGDLGNLARKRDGFSSADPGEWASLIAFLNDFNENWVSATRRLSPRLLCELLRFSGTRLHAYYSSLDPFGLGVSVDWAGPGPAPNWLDLAREYSEHWVHQQQIREAVQAPSLLSPRLFGPVLQVFVRALPHAYRHVAAPPGTVVTLQIGGAAGGQWWLVRDPNRWRLARSAPVAAATTTVSLDQDVAWRLWTKALAEPDQRACLSIEGERRLGEPVRHAVAILA